MILKRDVFQRELVKLEKKLDALRLKYPNYRSTKEQYKKERSEYAKKSRPIVLKMSAYRYYKRREERKIEIVKTIAHTICELSDLESLWQRGRARSPEVTKARHIFVVFCRQKGIGTWIVQWYLNLSANNVCGVSNAYKMGWKRIRTLPEYRESYNRINFALKEVNL